MIQDDAIVHEVRKSSFQNLQFDSEVLNVAILATLTTLLSYQLSGICYNIFLGTKIKGRATASDIHKLVLAEASSPLAVFAAIIRVDGLDRLRFKGDLPKDVRIVRRTARVSKLVTLSLIVLLLFAPLFNFISIFLVLQSDETFTFSQENFHGVSIGLSNETVSSQSFTDFCEILPLRIIGPALPLVQFLICFEFEVSKNFTIPQTTDIRIVAELTLQGQVKVSSISLPSNTPLSFAFRIDLSSDGKLYRTQPVFSVKEAVQIVHLAQERLATFCESAQQENSPHIESLLDIEDSNGVVRASKDFRCDLQNIQDYNEVLFIATEPINPIEHDLINVFRIDTSNAANAGLEANSTPEYFGAGDIPFIVRPTRNVNVLLLLVILCVSIVCRILTELWFNNDLDEAVEAILRYRLGVEPHESMLNSSRTVRYNEKSQVGRTAHYGLRRSSLPEVEQFDTGIEIGMDERSTRLRTRDEW